MTTVIAFASQKGGVGKTTSAINLSTAFAIGGYRVLMIDLDTQGSIRTSFGIQEPVQAGIKELFCDLSLPLEEVCTKTDHENIDFIFSNIPHMADEQEILDIASNKHYLKNWLRHKVKTDYDFVIIDSPPSISPLSINALVASDLIVIPLQCEALAVKSLTRFLRTFKELQQQVETNLRIAGILLTMYDRKIETHRVISRQVFKMLHNSVFETIVPKCDEIIKASALGTTVIHKNLPSIGSTAYIRFANEILNRFNLR